ncbi:MAG: hypothetical protein OEY23_22460 [Acidimicrobiia bacterium]|nr:hypothetical protein [Acidimicrobiia bacterium]
MIVALESAEFVLTAWAVVLGSIGLYGARVVRRGRRLSGRVAPERRRFL